MIQEELTRKWIDYDNYVLTWTYPVLPEQRGLRQPWLMSVFLVDTKNNWFKLALFADDDERRILIFADWFAAWFALLRGEILGMRDYHYLRTENGFFLFWGNSKCCFFWHYVVSIVDSANAEHDMLFSSRTRLIPISFSTNLLTPNEFSITLLIPKKFSLAPLIPNEFSMILLIPKKITRGCLSLYRCLSQHQPNSRPPMTTTDFIFSKFKQSLLTNITARTDIATQETYAK